MDEKWTLDSWLAQLAGSTRTAEPKHAWAFPSDELRDQYLAEIRGRSEDEVRLLIRSFLIPSGSLGIDRDVPQQLSALKHTDPETAMRIKEFEYYRRVIAWRASGGKAPPPWEGITWVLDLLPHHPREAITVLDAYFVAHCQLMPDGRINGLQDSIDLIRGKYIGFPGTQNERVRSLLDLGDRDFECLVERLYDSMGYATLLTPPKRDGGRDIVASKTMVSDAQSLRIECKRYSDPVGVEVVRALLGVVADEKATKGVIVAAGTFTKGSREFAERNARLELITGDEFVRLMNEYEGSQWPTGIDRLVRESENANHKNRQSGL